MNAKRSITVVLLLLSLGCQRQNQGPRPFNIKDVTIEEMGPDSDNGNTRGEVALQEVKKRVARIIARVPDEIEKDRILDRICRNPRICDNRSLAENRKQ